MLDLYDKYSNSQPTATEDSEKKRDVNELEKMLLNFIQFINYIFLNLIDKDIFYQASHISQEVINETSHVNTPIEDDQEIKLEKAINIHLPSDNLTVIRGVPHDIWLLIFSYIYKDQFPELARVCKTFSFLTKNPSLLKKAKWAPRDYSELLKTEMFDIEVGDRESDDSQILSIRALPNGNIITTHLIHTKHQHNLKISDLKTGKCIRVLEGHNGTSRTPEISPQGDIVTIGPTGNVHILNSESGELKRILQINLCQDESAMVKARAERKTVSEHHPDKAYSLAFLSDGDIVTGHNCLIRIWNYETGELKNTYRLHEKSKWYENYYVRSIKAISNNRFVAGYSSGMIHFTHTDTLYLWNAKTGENEPINKTGANISVILYIAILPNEDIVTYLKNPWIGKDYLIGTTSKTS